MKRSKTLKGLFWSFSDNLLQQLVNFGVGIILARLLTPEDFGLVGIISVFIALSNTFVNSGLSDALINKQDATEKDYNTVFWSNVFLGVVTYVLLYMLAPFISDFFERDELTILIRITALSVLIVSFSSIQRAILTKILDFKSITIVSIVSVLISGSVAVYMAFNGYGVMSLVIRMVLGQAMTLILFWLINKWRPNLIFDFNSLKSMYKYGVNLFASRFINSLYTNVYYFVIGKVFNPATLGYYTRAETFNNLASTNIANTIQRVSFAALSSKKTRKEQFSTFELFFNTTILITFSLMALIFSAAHEIVILLIGVKWLPSVLYLKLLTLSGLFLPLYALNLNLFAVMQRTKHYLRIELYAKLFIIPTILIGFLYGIEALIVMIVISSIASYTITLVSMKWLLNYDIRIQFSMVLKSILFFSSVILCGFLIDEYLGLNTYLMMVIKIVSVFAFTIPFLVFAFPSLLLKLLNIIKID